MEPLEENCDPVHRQREDGVGEEYTSHSRDPMAITDDATGLDAQIGELTRPRSSLEFPVNSVSSYSESYSHLMSVEQSEPDSFMYLSSDWEEPMSHGTFDRAEHDGTGEVAADQQDSIFEDKNEPWQTQPDEHYANVGADETMSCWAVPSKPHNHVQNQGWIDRTQLCDSLPGNSQQLHIPSSSNMQIYQSLSDMQPLGQDSDRLKIMTRQSGTEWDATPRIEVPGFQDRNNYGAGILPQPNACFAQCGVEGDVEGDRMLDVDLKSDRLESAATLLGSVLDIHDKSGKAAPWMFNELPLELREAINISENMQRQPATILAISNSTSDNGINQSAAGLQESYPNSALLPSGALKPSSPNFVIPSGSSMSPARTDHRFLQETMFTREVNPELSHSSKDQEQDPTASTTEIMSSSSEREHRHTGRDHEPGESHRCSFLNHDNHVFGAAATRQGQSEGSLCGDIGGSVSYSDHCPGTGTAPSCNHRTDTVEHPGGGASGCSHLVSAPAGRSSLAPLRKKLLAKRHHEGGESCSGTEDRVSSQRPTEVKRLDIGLGNCFKLYICTLYLHLFIYFFCLTENRGDKERYNYRQVEIHE